MNVVCFISCRMSHVFLGSFKDFLRIDIWNVSLND